MNPDWQDFLTKQQAHIKDGVVQDFGDAAAELIACRDGTVLCDLSQFGTLKISGEEAQNFLQNLLSSDVQEISLHRAQLSSLNNPKGRMLASFLIWRSESAYFLQLPLSLCGPIAKRLSMYILRAKVKIEDISAHQICLGLSGSGAAELLQQNFAESPADIWAVQQHDHATIVRVSAQCFQIFTTLQNAPALWEKLSPSARPVASVCWDWLNIRAGIPVILPVTQEQFVAQMVNLELLGGVSFKKGCYPGQEIVARMQYLGKLKRRMVLAHVEPDQTVPQAGDELFSADMENQSSGMVVNACAAPNGGYDLLAVIQTSSRETHSIHLQSLQGSALQILPLPY